MSKVRWGLVSTANINLKVIPAIQQSKRGEITAIASRDIDRAQAYARQWNIPYAYGSYQKMFVSGDVDAVYISLPNQMHAEWSIKAMQAGLHVLVEKPMATTLKDVDDMIVAHKKTGMMLAEALMYRHHPQTRIIREFIRSGELGEVSIIRGTFNIKVSSEQDNRLSPELGGGSLWHIGVYPLSFAQHIMGEPPVKAAGAQNLGPRGVDEYFGGQMWYSHGTIAQISSSLRMPFLTTIEMLGTKGRLFIDRPFTGIEGGKVTFYPEQQSPKKLKMPQMYLYRGEIEDMQAAILDGTPNLVTLDESRNHIKTALALYKSAQTGEIVKV